MATNSDQPERETSPETTAYNNNNDNDRPITTVTASTISTSTTATDSVPCEITHPPTSDPTETSSKMQAQHEHEPSSSETNNRDNPQTPITATDSTENVETSSQRADSETNNHDDPQTPGAVSTDSTENVETSIQRAESSSSPSSETNHNDDTESPISTTSTEPPPSSSTNTTEAVSSEITVDQTCSPPQISNSEISCIKDDNNNNNNNNIPVNICIEDPIPCIPCKIHRVCPAPRFTTFQKLTSKLREIFFPDDPLYAFKNQSLLRKIVLAIEYVFPIAKWIQTYNFELFRSDLIAGITIASLAIPQGISYAKLAYMPPITGLYSSFVPPMIYAVFGTSRHLCVGPVSISSMIIGTAISEKVSPTDERDLFVQLAFTSTLFAGLFQTCLGILRLGFIVDFLSKATLTGFMAGSAAIVALQQLKGLLGITHFTTKMQIIPVVKSVFSSTKEWSGKTIILSVFFLLILLIAKHVSSKKPKLFWIAAAAPLTSVVLSTLMIAIFKNPFKEVSQIGYMPNGVNPSSMHLLYFHGPHVSLAVKTGIIVGIMSLTEGVAVSRTFASMSNYNVDGNKEMIAIGLLNVCGCLSSCYVATGSFSRSAVVFNAGGKTAMSNIIMSLAILMTLLFLLPLFFHTPNLVLAAIIVTAVIGLIDFHAAYKLWKLDKLDFAAFLCSFLGVLFVSVQIGLTIAVGVSVFKIILHVTRPNTTLLGQIPGTQIYQSLNRYENASRIPSFLILSIESPIFFANSSYLQERIWRWIRDEQDRIEDSGDALLRCIIIDMSAVTTIDSSGVDAILELRNTMSKRSLQLVLVNPVGSVLEKLQKSKVIESFTSNGLYLTIAEAVVDISASWRPWP